MKPWLAYALATTILWGIWGAFTEASEMHGFPGTLGYVVWAFTMLIPATISLSAEGFKIDRSWTAIYYGMLIGVAGAAGTVALFKALAIGPAYLIFPIIALSPVITVCLSLTLLKERTGLLGAIGVVMALVSILLFSQSDPKTGHFQSGWLVLAIGIMLAWGIQAYYMKVANLHMSSASIFFYMTVCGLLFIPLTIWMTDFSMPVNWGVSGMGVAAVVQLLNAIGACTLVFAFRDGKAVIVSPLCNALAPLMTVLISLAWHRTLPDAVKGAAIILAITAALLMVIDDAQHQSESNTTSDEGITPLRPAARPRNNTERSAQQ